MSGVRRSGVLSDDAVAHELGDAFGVPDGAVSGDGLGESYSERVSARGGLVRVLAGGGVLLGSAALSSPSSSACRSPSLAGLPGASGSAPEALCRGLSAAGPRGASVSALVSARRRGRSAAGVPGGAEPVASSSMPDGLDGGELSDFSSSDSGEDGTGWGEQEWTRGPDLGCFGAPRVRSSERLPGGAGPLTCFSLFFGDDVLDIVVDQTNLYAVQVGSRNYTPTTKEEIMAWYKLVWSTVVFGASSLKSGEGWVGGFVLFGGCFGD